VVSTRVMSKDFALSARDFLSPLRSVEVWAAFCDGTPVRVVLKSDEAVEGAKGDGVIAGARSGVLDGVAVDGGFILSGSASVGTAFSATIPAHKTAEAIRHRARDSLNIRLTEESESELAKLLRLAFGFKTGPDTLTMWANSISFSVPVWTRRSILVSAWQAGAESLSLPYGS
jgi:hypothetical protein